MRTGKILGWVLGVPAALIGIAMLAAWVLINPNNYRERIAADVKEATGRELTLKGDLTLSVFPWLAFNLGPSSLGNPPGFGDQPFLSFEHASVRIRLLPLLFKRLEVGQIEIDGLDVNLIKDAAGAGNWQGFGRLGGSRGQEGESRASGGSGSEGHESGGRGSEGRVNGQGGSGLPGSEGHESGGRGSEGQVNGQGGSGLPGSEGQASGGPGNGERPAAGASASGGNPAGATAQDREDKRGGLPDLKIVDARVHYREFTVEHLNLETGSFAERGLVPVTLRADVNRGVADEHVSIDARVDIGTDIGADPAALSYSLAALNANGLMTLAGNNRPVRFSIAAPAITVNLAAQTLTAPDVAVDVAGAHLNGSVEGTTLVDAPSFKGTWTLAPLVVREYLPRLGMTGPVTRDPKALSLVSGAGGFNYGEGSVHLAPLQVTLDDTHVSGSAALVNGDTHEVAFDLKADRLDLDRYLPPAETDAGTTGGPRHLGTSETGTGISESGGSEPELPEQRTPTPATRERAGPWQANGTLSVGAVHLAPLDLSNVSVTVASQDHMTRFFPLTAQIDGGHYSGDIRLDNRNGTRRLTLDEHLTGIDVGRLTEHSKNLRLSGRGNVNLTATGHGAGSAEILRTLDGRFDAEVANGALEGIDLGYQLGRAEALLNRQSTPAAPDTRRTAFEAFKMSAQITNGEAVMHDLIISSAALRITGRGSVNLPTQALDVALLADTTKAAGSIPIELPVRVTGTVADPAVRPDVQALFKGELKQKVKDLLHDKLQSLFGKP